MASRPELSPNPVWLAIQAIPKGSTASYGQIALRAGYPGRARWVARVLASGSGPERLPWHRVVRSDGSIAFPPGSSEFEEQVQRLRAEGVVVRNGRASADSRRGLDEAIWG